jgi:hypothetical protein
MREWLFDHLPAIIGEHIVWIIIGGVLLAFTGFTPEEWITQAINRLRTTSTNTLIRTVRIVIGLLGVLFIVVALSGLLSNTVAPASLSDSHPPLLGAEAAFNIVDEIHGKANGLAVPDGWSVVITGPPESGYVQTVLKLILQKAIGKIEFKDVPDSSPYIDAPRFPATAFSGIIIHGSDALTQTLLALGGCFKIKMTQVMLPGLEQHFHAKNLVWIEIGNSPWWTSQVCTG